MLFEYGTRQEAALFVKKNLTGTEKPHYCYMLSVDKVPFYIGLSKNHKRLLEHEAACSLASNTYKNNKIKYLRSKQEKIEYSVIQSFHTRDESEMAERSLILFYGRTVNGGLLTNATDGGDGVSGGEGSELQRETVRTMMTGRTVSEESIAKQKATMKALREAGYVSPLKGRKRSEEAKRKTRETCSKPGYERNSPKGESHYLFGKKRPDAHITAVKDGIKAAAAMLTTEQLEQKKAAMVKASKEARSKMTPEQVEARNNAWRESISKNPDAYANRSEVVRKIHANMSEEAKAARNEKLREKIRNRTPEEVIEIQRKALATRRANQQKKLAEKQVENVNPSTQTSTVVDKP